MPDDYAKLGIVSGAQSSKEGLLLPILSVIIPVHNDARWANAFCEHIRVTSQSELGSRVEFIVVDDASADESAHSFTEGLRHIGPVQTIRLASNRGPGEARNLGLQVAQGQFVTFWDSDDLVNPPAYLELIDSMIRGKHVVGALGYEVCSDSGERIVEPTVISQALEILDLVWLRAGIWRFVFETRFLRERGVTFSAGRYGEDLQFLLNLGLLLRRDITVINAVGYLYFADSGPMKHKGLESGSLISKLYYLHNVPDARGYAWLLSSWIIRVWLRSSPWTQIRTAPLLLGVVCRDLMSGSAPRLLRGLLIARRFAVR